MTRFAAADVERAHCEWRCSCGPAALAAICDLTLDDVRPHFGERFPGYTNPTLMLNALRSASVRWSSIGVPRDSGTAWPSHGICRIQWEGPWMEPGVPAGARYQRTHWIGVSQGTGSRGRHLVDIWDVNCVGYCPAVNLLDNDGWIPLEFWAADVVPRLTAEIRRATGGWHITHAIEVERRTRRSA